MIASRVIAWQRRAGRNDLPWQQPPRDAYRIWLSEIMLQQTRVATVLRYYADFLERFPDVRSLASAPLDDVLAAWSGLGYYGRARNLHRCAIEVVERRGGEFPRDPDELARLPGIGRSTAAAIAAFAWGRRAAILDGNVRRVLSRHAGVRGCATQRAVLEELWRIAERKLPDADIERYTQGLMDLGATVCLRARARCASCPIAADCTALREDAVHEIPARRPRRELAQRTCVLLVIRRATEVLVEKRAHDGIWGGLWSLPEAGPESDHAREIARRYALHAVSRGSLPVIEHDFTHLRLRARPLVFECVRANGVGEAGTLRWLPLADAHAAALPSPVKALLLRLRAPGADAGTDGSATGA